MESGPRRRRRSLPLVAAFLRDPGSGRVYRRGELIGQGASSHCYKLTDLSTSSVFALKVEHEIALHSRLRHLNIVAFHGHFADHDSVYLALEYCSRQSLAHVLKARQTLTEPEVRYYLRGLVSGLSYLHRRRIVHRDLKLSNFFLNKNMEVKIGDLGLAARVGPGGCCYRVLCGTPNFLAPEVISRKGHSCQSDIWALGCTMCGTPGLPRYMVLTGAPPFSAAPLSEMYQNIREGHYPEPAHVSPSAHRLISRLLAPNPAAPPSLEQVLQDDFFTQPPASGQAFPEGGPPDADPVLATLPPPVHLLTQGTLRCEPAGPEGSPWPEVAAAISRLQCCLEAGPPVLQEPLGEQRAVLWAPKWVDYSRKYGFSYQLSDGGSSVLFRDGTHMSLCPPGGQVCYAPHRGRLEMFLLRNVPAVLGTKLAILWLFSCYLQQQLRQEGAMPMSSRPGDPRPCLLRFLASEPALLLIFSNRTVQVTFSADQAHLVLSGEGKGLLLTLWEQGRPRACYPLDVLRSHGCVPAARQRLCQALRLLQSI